MSRLSRRHDWPERLAEFLAQAASRAFAWGETDCCLFACDAVLAITDCDLAADFRGAYSSQLGAANAMAAYLRNVDLPIPESVNLLEGFVSAIANEHGIAEIAPAFAQRGDVVLFDQATTATASTLGVVDGHGTHAVSTAPDGPVSIPVSVCRRAWRIG